MSAFQHCNMPTFFITWNCSKMNRIFFLSIQNITFLYFLWLIVKYFHFRQCRTFTNVIYKCDIQILYYIQKCLWRGWMGCRLSHKTTQVSGPILSRNFDFFQLCCQSCLVRERHNKIRLKNEKINCCRFTFHLLNVSLWKTTCNLKH